MFYVNLMATVKQKSRAKVWNKTKQNKKGKIEQLTVENYQLTKVDKNKKENKQWTNKITRHKR